MRWNLSVFPGVAVLCLALSGSAGAQTVVGKIAVTDDTTGLADSIREVLRPLEGQEYSAQTDGVIRAKAEEELAAHGYLEATVEVTHEAPQQQEGHALVNVMASVT